MKVNVSRIIKSIANQLHQEGQISFRSFDIIADLCFITDEVYDSDLYEKLLHKIIQCISLYDFLKLYSVLRNIFISESMNKYVKSIAELEKFKKENI